MISNYRLKSGKNTCGERMNKMSEIGFNGCKLELQLMAQTPHLHFQGKEVGATLRGSELKPKLDKYLKAKGYGGDLKYKVSIVSDKKQVADLGQYPLFYGDRNMITGIWTNPIITIICFQEELQKFIKDNIIDFFLVTNFGVMQGKGFGSYIPREAVKIEAMKVVQVLKETYGVNTCWYVDVKTKLAKYQRCEEQMNWIKSFYGIMKSGQNFRGYERSFIFEYMHKNPHKIVNKSAKENIVRSIDNEKAWMKQTGIAPIYSKKSDNKRDNLHTRQQDANPRFIRAFLGLSTNQSWLVGNRERMTITIASKNDIERIPSPIFFKIIDDKIFFIAKSIRKDLYDQEFEFIGKKSGTLITPKEEDFKDGQFDIERFMAEYVTYYNRSLIEKATCKIDNRDTRVFTS